MNSCLKRFLTILVVLLLGHACFASKPSSVRQDAFNRQLLQAADQGQVLQIKKLIALGADVNSKDKNGIHPLDWAIFGNHVGAFQELMNAGASVTHQDNYVGFTPLHMAALVGNPLMVRTLILHGTNIESKSKIGWVPLHVAVVADKNNSHIIGLLLKAGAKIDARDNDGNTPFATTATMANSWMKSVPIAQILFNAGADVNATNNLGQTPLHLAADQGVLPLVKFLCEHGANMNAKDKEGQTPLISVGSIAPPSVSKCLLAHGADVNAQDNQGETLLHKMAIENVPYPDVAEVLLAAGAQPNLLDKQGRTPLKIAMDLIRSDADNAYRFRKWIPILKSYGGTE